MTEIPIDQRRISDKPNIFELFAATGDAEALADLIDYMTGTKSRRPIPAPTHQPSSAAPDTPRNRRI